MILMLRERYLAAVNAKAASLLADPRKNETERFWGAMKLMDKEARALRDCLDGHSRSKMQFHVVLMIGPGMIEKEDLDGFSAEFREHVSHAFAKRH